MLYVNVQQPLSPANNLHAYGTHHQIPTRTDAGQRYSDICRHTRLEHPHLRMAQPKALRPKYRNAIYNRDWLYVSEVQDLSDYAGYDLLTGQRLPDK